MGALLVMLVSLAFLGGVVYLMVLGAGFFSIERKVSKEARLRAAVLENATQVLDRTFVGDPVTVYTGPVTLPFETWVAGGLERGYELAGQQGNASGGVLVFRRTQGR